MPIRNILPLAIGLFTIAGARAQEKKMTTVQEAPIAMNMNQFANTALGQLRQKQYGSTFGGADGSVSKKIKYSDGSSLNLHLVKNPSFGGQATSIKANVKNDGKPDKSRDSQGNEWNCSTEHIQLTAQSTTFLNNDYSASASHIYPGAVYTYENFYDGSYKEQDGERNPLTIITDNTNIKGKPYVTINNPNTATIRTAVDEIFQGTENKPIGTESLSYQIYESSTLADESMKISGGASGYGVALTAGYGTSSTSKTRTLTIDALKTMFSINTIPPDKGFFKNKDVESKPNLMVIGSVSYGVRVLANITLTFDSEGEAAAFSASYSGWGVSANVDFKQISENKAVNNTINCYIVGGPGNSTVTFNKKDLKKQIEEVIAKATYKNAMPVKYEFYDMAGHVIGSNSATDQFPVRQCTPANGGDPRLLSALVTIQTGNDDKEKDSRYTMVLTNGKAMDIDKIMKPDNKYLVFKGKAGSMEYGEQSSETRKLLPGSDKPLSLSDFQKDGGVLILRMYPDGDDEWDISNLTLEFNFENGANISNKPLTYSKLRLSEDAKTAWLYFDKSLNAAK
jgi:hypothetical protein